MNHVTNPILWRHPAPETTPLHAFATAAAIAASSGDFSSYEVLHRWSVTHPEDFWRLWLAHSAIAHSGTTDLVHDGGPFHRRVWFPHVTLSVAGNLLRHGLTEHADRTEALVAYREASEPIRITYGALVDAVLALRARLAPILSPGDAVAGVVPNGVEAVVMMLASVSLGAVWSSASPDFGTEAVIDRFSQVEPKVLLGCSAYRYGGTRFDVRPRMEAILNKLPSVELALAIPSDEGDPEPRGFHPLRLDDLIDRQRLADTPRPATKRVEGDTHRTDRARQEAVAAFPEFPFDHPLYTMFSSGTTGTPKGIIHGGGGTLLQHTKEHILHGDVGPGDRILYFTTCGWMMWNWLVSALFTGATVVLYDGSPMWPTGTRLWEIARDEHLTHLGVSPRYVAACRSRKVDARAHTGTLRVLFSTGAPLLPEDFDYVYERLAPHAQLASISGGTDIISCFMLGVPTLPVRRGEIQAAGLGMDVIAADGDGRPLLRRRGELVCRTPFPSRPIGFLGDDVHDSRLRRAYFERFSGWWTHGDYVEITGSVGEIGGIIVYGRSDATLNPGGVRIGTAEIYRHVEALPEIEDSLAVGRPVEGDVEVVLFVVPAGGFTVDDALRRRIRDSLREHASPRHVPKHILAVSAIPYTRSGKKVELAVRDILHGTEPTNVESLADSSVLDEYRRIAVHL
ncbi:MAG: acetoacetate--CoA ligase [Alkalispirochaeta sp.]